MSKVSEPAPRPIYDPHAELQMRHRSITKQQIEYVLANYHTSHPAQPLPRTARRSVIYVGTIDSRELRVYVLEGSDPPYVRTAAWRDE